ncbi:MAG: 50S ribosomal protein L30 [Armatimonadetes bacterium]|jgi:large subunit ribosomal protein L30|nr:MAG: 50S ribosomal protein L30 [Armatimonadota bacterium]GIV03410.1 MAG: 50S ribosomal protein L30 [Fimbriimonadales bacterium]
MKIQVKLVRSPIGSKPRNRKTLQALGLRKLNQVVIHEDSPSLRGMLHNVRHMVEVRPVHE